MPCSWNIVQRPLMTRGQCPHPWMISEPLANTYLCRCLLIFPVRLCLILQLQSVYQTVTVIVFFFYFANQPTSLQSIWYFVFRILLHCIFIEVTFGNKDSWGLWSINTILDFFIRGQLLTLKPVSRICTITLLLIYLLTSHRYIQFLKYPVFLMICFSWFALILHWVGFLS